MLVDIILLYTLSFTDGANVRETIMHVAVRSVTIQLIEVGVEGAPDSR